jgi:5-methylcytosine-specific restriction endonuclease McrA
VHHVISKAKGGTDDMSNLIAINSDCHKRETAKQQGRTIKPKVKIGVDGWPIA